MAPAEPQLPPLALAPNSARTESASLGASGFTVSRSIDSQGNPVDDLRAPGGEVIAHNISDTATATFQNQEYDLARVNTGNGTQFTLTSHADPSHSFSAMLPPADRMPVVANLGGTLSGTGNMAEDSVALRSTSGTLLLEDGGDTVLIPQGDSQNAYDTLTLQPGGQPANFTSGGREVSLSQNENGDRVVALRGQNGSSESFTVRMTGDGAYNVSHAVNGQLADNTYVSTDGQSTYYAKYDAADSSPTWIKLLEIRSTALCMETIQLCSAPSTQHTTSPAIPAQRITNRMALSQPAPHTCLSQKADSSIRLETVKASSSAYKMWVQVNRAPVFMHQLAATNLRLKSHRNTMHPTMQATPKTAHKM